jgi:hypothetical protein
MELPGVSELLRDVNALEDYIRAYRSREEVRMVLITREEADVIDSYRRFMTEEY